MILILSNKWDVTVDFVVKELQKRGYPYIRINTEDLPEMSVTTEIPKFSVTIEKQNQTVDLSEEIGAAWYRRPGKPFEFTEKKPDQATLDYIREQWSAWLQSLQTIPEISWVNHPESNQRMESKIHQLRLADRLGFKIPETTVTNNGSDVVELFEKHDSIISKALSSPLINEENQEEFVFSVHLDDAPSENDERLKICPTIFQEPKLPKVDYRVTVIDETVLPVKIESEEGESVPTDWRTGKESVQFVEKDLPSDVENLCKKYVNEAGLTFGAIDLVKIEGQFVFLEINPNGEWGWLEKPWNVPISKNLTDCLIKKDNKE